MKNYKAPFYMGGGTETELVKFNLQRFATVDNPYQAIINSNIITSGLVQRPLVTLWRYCISNISNYSTMTKLPQEDIEYLSSGLAASNCAYMFSSCIKLVSIPWNEFNIDTSECTTMEDMFSSCRALTSLDLSNFDTSKVKNMNSMFSNCASLQEIICPDGFDLSSCTKIASMFWFCDSYIGEPLHFKNVPRSLDISERTTLGTEGKHYVIDSYLD